ncbi:AtpZ/AtpI family protein [Hyphomonas sp.]|jgi:ATP synthase protein I|uniref:AtpZ/AtpI family protein n=1 Tax=Hyphomonas sp. TaxID=87 RepID=UPI000420E0C8|nr:AtpZ/AtpI family protein [Hyphomonas sp.]MEE2921936.1 AtpZ/AtpI family protein [Pseudomonadota bacterium]
MSSEGPNDLGERIAQAQAARAAKEAAKRKLEPDDGSLSAGAYALRYGAEFVACVFVGGLIGYWIDAFAGTKPWGLLIVGTLGFAAGIRAMMRAYRELNARAQGHLQEPEAPTDGTGNE